MCDQVSDEFPRDLAIVKTHQYFEFNRGNSPEMLRVALKVGAANSDVPYIYGMKAFGYEQCHLLDEAESEARAGACDAPQGTLGSARACARVFDARPHRRRRAIPGRRRETPGSGSNSFMLTHIWWHLALFYLSQGRESRGVRLYDEHCWGSRKELFAGSGRRRLAAGQVRNRGHRCRIRAGTISAIIWTRARRTRSAISDLQYLYGLARARRPEAETLLESVRAYAERAPAIYARGMAGSCAAGMRGLVCLRTRRIRALPGIT